MDGMIEFTDYQDQYKDRIIELLAAGKSPEYRQKKEKIWDWQYNANPFAKNAPKGVVLLYDGEMAGFNGSMHIQLKYHDELIRTFWSMDTIVDPDYRGKGLGHKLSARVYGANPLVIGFGLSDIQAHIRKKQGAKPNKQVQEYFFWNKAETIRNIVKKGIQHAKQIKSLGARPSTAELNATVAPTLPSPAVVDDLWEKTKAGYEKIIVRNHSYLKWKYAEYPLSYYYYIAIMKKDEMAGIGVFRKDSEHSKLVDFLGPAKDIGIKYAVTRTFKEQCADSDFLSCITTDEEFMQCLEMAGFRRYVNQPRFFIHSTLPDDPDPEDNWFLMTGDSDGDISL